MVKMVLRYFNVFKLRRFICSKSRLKYMIILALFLLIIAFITDINHLTGFHLLQKLKEPKSVNSSKHKTTVHSCSHISLNHAQKKVVHNEQHQVIQFSKTVTPVETPSVLIFADSEKTIHKSKLKNLFKSLRINFDFVSWNRIDDYSLSMPRLQDKYGNTRYHTIIFTSHYIYDEMDSYNKNILLKHCLNFKIGIVIFADIMHVNTQTKFHSLKTLPVLIQSGIISLRDLHVEKNSMLRITKAGNTLKGIIHGKRHALFHTSHKSFEPVASATKINGTLEKWSFLKSVLKSEEEIDRIKTKNDKGVIVMFDQGKFDGIRRVLFGTTPTNSWLTQLIFLDALSVLSNNVFGFNTDRFMQIDIDDIFVGQSGMKLVEEDVKEIIKAQDYLANFISGFKFNLGFSFKQFKNSNTSDERKGDAALVENADKFRWFCHTYGHIKPHQYTTQELIDDLRMNKNLAETYRLPVDTTYSVAPHHSGVYPTHESLYDAWKKVWGIKVTSTERYPHLYPSWGRKGFIYKNIMILPRQTCGIFTTTLHLATHPKGPDYLFKISHGGELFWSIINNPITIFMTHQGNYGHKDRLAIHLFKNVTNFITKWTNIKLKSIKPLDMAKKYFELFPRSAEPLWGDPCADARHHQPLWNDTEKYCQVNKVSRISRLPDVLIVGPQKTGTAALYSYLSMHPDIHKSRQSNSSFEEIQFFNRNHYMKGLRWYLDFFPDGVKKKGHLFAEKSANYFDSLKTPLRAYSIVPHAKLIMISIDPRYRAYSWYQHIKSKKESVALNHTFYDILTGVNSTNDQKFNVLKDRCLLPGRYAEALDRWLHYYDKSQIYIMDGDELRYEPHLAMRKLQDFLKVSHFPFHKRIKYNRAKGFFCATFPNGSFRCLGKSKGRRYGSMSEESYQFLSDYYRVLNLRLADQMTALKKPLPRWLQREIKDKNNS